MENFICCLTLLWQTKANTYWPRILYPWPRQDPATVFASFGHALPGDSGTRNPLRGDGYFSWDNGLDKEFRLTERFKMQLRWEMFNITNSVRFDSHSISATLDNPQNFGQATVLLTNKRLAQFSARVEF
jgi:hypothetical protein